jgi:hypothetical protein
MVMIRVELRSTAPSFPGAIDGRFRGMKLSDLATPDRMTLRFSPAGLLTAGELLPEDSLRYLNAMLEEASLNAQVPGEVQQAFERLKAIHRYGVFYYGFFSVAANEASLVTELAFGIRFIDAHRGRVVLVERHGDEQAVLHPGNYRDVVLALSPRGSHPHRARKGERSWMLEGHPTFDASFNSLLAWARAEGLLKRWLDDRWERSEDRIKSAALTRTHADTAVPSDWNEMGALQREKWWTALRDRWEAQQLDVVKELRNLVAHPTYHQVVTPVSSAGAILAAAALTNSLWLDAMMRTQRG